MLCTLISLGHFFQLLINYTYTELFTLKTAVVFGRVIVLVIWDVLATFDTMAINDI